jgi:phenylalanyl-tRNA synthetase beta chain
MSVSFQPDGNICYYPSIMKTSLNWLNQYLDRAIDADEAGGLLTAQGFPIEAVEPVRHGVSAIGSDTMLDVEVTSNRGDCLSHVGVAREIAAGCDRVLTEPGIELPGESGESAAELTGVGNDAPDLCPVYTARVIRGVKVAPSPAWLIDRLETIGLRSVNNVVDVTNYVLHELGQPMHAFDMRRLGGQRVVVRRAKPGERFVAIDGSKHELTDQMLVIADAVKPVAVAGVMGGLDSEVGDATTDILLESARFEPLSIRRTARRLKLASDSSYRFERGVDPCGVERASRRAAQLIIELAGGTLAPGVIRVGEAEPDRHEVAMRVERCRDLLGNDMSSRQMAELLAALDLSPTLVDGERIIICRIPTYRLDLHREVDLIEEVARLHGLDDVAMHEKLTIEVRPPQDSVRARRAIGRTLAGHGYHEAITFSFLSPKLGEPFVSPNEKPLRIEDERRKAEPMLRPSLLPSLLTCRKTNQDVGNHGLKLFEVASTWTRQSDGGDIIERTALSLIADCDDPQQGVRELRGAISELVEQLCGRDIATFAPGDAASFSDAAHVTADGKTIGVLGVIDAATLDRFGLQTKAVGAELSASALIAMYPPKHVVADLPRFPAIERDLSVVVDEATPFADIEKHVRDAQPALMEQLEHVVTYRGKPIEKGRKSVTLRLLFRDATTTLRHDQVDPQMNAVIERLKSNLGAELRV